MTADDILLINGHYYLVDRSVHTLDCIGKLCYIRESGTIKIYEHGHSSFADLVVASTDESTGLPPMPEDYDLYIDPVNVKASAIVGMIHSGIEDFKKKETKRVRFKSKMLHKFYKRRQILQKTIKNLM